MNLHEYQSKQLLKSYQIPVPESLIASTAADVGAAVDQLGGERWVIKAQVRGWSR